jgi:hypothetical protein
MMVRRKKNVEKGEAGEIGTGEACLRRRTCRRYLLWERLAKNMTSSQQNRGNRVSRWSPAFYQDPLLRVNSLIEVLHSSSIS